MSEAYRQLVRTIPERHAPPAGAALDPRALRNWLAGLPLASVASTSRQVVERLQQMNQQRAAALERLDALEAIRPVAQQLIDMIEQQTAAAALPLQPQRAELAARVEEIHQALALGYLEALYDACAPAGTVPMLKGGRVALAGLRALQHGGERLQRAYAAYRVPASGAWQLMHGVHRFLASVKLDERGADEGAHVALRSPRLVYQHALLLALANPYRYSRRELPAVVALTRALASYCDLRDGEVEGLRTVDMLGDREPGHAADDGERGRQARIAIDPARLLAYVESCIVALPPGAHRVALRAPAGPSVEVDIDVVRRMVVSLADSSARDHARMPGGQPLDAVIGLHDLHRALAGGLDFDSFLQDALGIAVASHDRPAAWTQGGADLLRVLPGAARVLDQSAAGYRLCWNHGADSDLVRMKVGDAIGLSLPAPAADQADWMVGVVRWMRIDDGGRVEAGVELLARRALPVAVRSLDGGAQGRPPLRGILLESLQPEHGSGYTSLLTPVLLDRAPERLELSVPTDPWAWWIPAGTRQVHGPGVIDRTGSHLHLALPPAEAVEQETSAAA
ncbi:MAG TPA: hypothetical protein VMR06_08460 [Dokdonella sp.]|uniref:hypothetical protein n=1 Tax=Dokdonella sp. TaxID=2291710 RepID=UPI002BE60EAF|nr:hypothetical protein [Dokdonella sp.]HUD42013.1 hypothetical protein [Dokdonella sp.]